MKRTQLFLLSGACLLAASCSGNTQTNIYGISETPEGWRVTLDGTPLYYNGVGGAFNLDVAEAAGANAFRTWGGDTASIRADIAKAAEHHMHILQGIVMSKNIEDYRSDDYKNAKRAEVKLLAETFKDSPEIFAWGIGNEIELGGASAPEVWQFVDELSQTIKSIDKRHLTSCVICIPMVLDSIEAYAPSLNFVGINTYGAIDKIAPYMATSSYTRPYMVTEWGPSGFWEVDKTSWDAPIEQTGEEKRVVYEERYNNYIKPDPRCMGSFVFLWGQKEERTPTWFSMFIEKEVEGTPFAGQMSPTVEAMFRVWNGTEPEKTAPVLHSMTLQGVPARESVRAKAGTPLKAEAVVSDAQGDSISYFWEVLEEASQLGFGGSYEPRPERAGEIAATETASYDFKIDRPGNYRVYVYAFDGTGYVTTANIPFQIY